MSSIILDMCKKKRKILVRDSLNYKNTLTKNNLSLDSTRINYNF